jgi:hypothetical protein
MVIRFPLGRDTPRTPSAVPKHYRTHDGVEVHLIAEMTELASAQPYTNPSNAYVGQVSV